MPSGRKSRGLRRSGRGKDAKPRLSHATASAAVERWGPSAPCVCGCGHEARQWHHIFDQHGYPWLADELDNIVPVARRCHEAHTSASRRYPRTIAHMAERLAVNEQMRRYLEREYAETPPPEAL